MHRPHKLAQQQATTSTTEATLFWRCGWEPQEYLCPEYLNIWDQRKWDSTNPLTVFIEEMVKDYAHLHGNNPLSAKFDKAVLDCCQYKSIVIHYW